MSIPNALDFFEHFQDVQSVVLELGRKLNVLAAVLLEHLFDLLLDVFVLSHQSQAVRGRLGLYIVD